MKSLNKSDKDTLPCQSKDTLDIMKENRAQNHLNILTFLSKLQKAYKKQIKLTQSFQNMLYVLKWIKISKFGVEKHQMGHSIGALGGCFCRKKWILINMMKISQKASTSSDVELNSVIYNHHVFAFYRRHTKEWCTPLPPHRPLFPLTTHLTYAIINHEQLLAFDKLPLNLEQARGQ